MVLLKRIWKRLAVAVNAVIVAALGSAIYMQNLLPDAYSVVAGEEITFHYPVTITQAVRITDGETTDEPGNCYQVDLKLMGAIQVKTVEVNVVDRKMVMVSGQPFGIKMFMDGLMVVGMSDVPSQGNRVNPAKDAGIQVGDILLSFNGTKLVTNEQLGELVQENGQDPIQLEIR